MTTLKSKKKSLSEDEISDDTAPQDDEEITSPSATRSKRSATKRCYAESDAEEDAEEDGVPMGKRVKEELNKGEEASS
jgi:hypothetical protein